jgi:hypothetical protein|tara:strand:- start:6099 stop:6329 length:231 start_codon:yes stop_codon:yes gene_type:complete
MSKNIELSNTDTNELVFILNWIADYASRGDLPNQGEPGDGSDTDYVINFAEELSDKVDSKATPEALITSFQKGFKS